MQIQRILFPSLMAALVVSALPAHASTVTYTDPTAWAAAAPGATSIDFSGLAPAGSFKDYSNSTGLAIGGVNFTGVVAPGQYSLDVMDQNYGSPWWNWGAPATLQSPIYNLAPNATFVPYTQATFSGGTTAFAADFMSISPNSLSYQVTLSDGETFTLATYGRPTQSFFGITTDAPITWADFTLLGTGTYSGSYGLLANFQYGAAAGGGTGGTGGTGGGSGDGSGNGGTGGGSQPADTPEACTLVLIGSGLVGLRSFRKYLPNSLA